MERNSTAQITFFASLCLFLSAVEYAIPHPVPFIRLGLANLPVMLSLQIFRRRDTILLCILKILGQSFLSGTIFSYIFLLSAAGSLASCFSMMFFYTIFWRTEKISWIGISIIGAFGNNAGQLLISRLIIFGENTKLIAPVLMSVSLVTGVLLGVFANIFVSKSSYWEVLINDVKSNENGTQAGLTDRHHAAQRVCPSRILRRLKWLQIGKRAQRVPSGVSDTAVAGPHFLFKPIPFIRNSLITIFAVTFFALFSPQGKVLFTMGNWRITQGALVTGLIKSAKLVSMVLVSKLFVFWGFKFPGRAGQFVNQVIAGFNQLTSEKINLKGKTIIQAIDSHLLNLTEFL